MSWPLASFSIVAIALAGGWLAYERARPSAKSVALVATLAAFAAIGRDAFAALPDVKPITAIAFVCGYALGPVSGFSIGAIGMLASNILLGEGPYTPWQMVAWGIVGLLGALAALLSRRHSGRLALALMCACSALIAKEIMNIYVWSIGGIYTPAALLARVAEGLPFDLTDVVATCLFGFAFGPELARMLARTRARMDVHWVTAEVARQGPGQPPSQPWQGPSQLGPRPAPEAGQNGTAGGVAVRGLISRALLGLLLLLCICQQAVVRTAGAERARARLAETGGGAAIERASNYLLSAQGADGAFGSEPGQPGGALYTAWAAIGLAGAGRDPAGISRGGHSVLSALRSQAASLEGPGDYERTMLALAACGVSARALGNVALESDLLRSFGPDGSISEQVNLTAFGILALRAAGHSAQDPQIAAAGRWLLSVQSASGGFSYAPHSAADVDDTAAVLEALAAADLSGTAAAQRAIAYIDRNQNRDGGFPQQPEGESNAQSTAWAIQGLIATGQRVQTLHHNSSASPISYLLGLQAADGSIRYSSTSSQTPVWTTAEALPALAGRALPIAPTAAAEAAPAAAVGHLPAAIAPSVSPGDKGRRRRRNRLSFEGAPQGIEASMLDSLLAVSLDGLGRAAAQALGLDRPGLR